MGLHSCQREVRHCFELFLVGGVWSGILFGEVRGEIVPCRFCVEADDDGHLFWCCTYHPLGQLLANPELTELIQRERETYPDAYLVAWVDPPEYIYIYYICFLGYLT